MSIVHVEAVGKDGLDRATRMLAGIEGGLDKALRNAMDRAASHLRTNSTKAIRERYAISAANIRANQNVKVRYSYQNGVQAVVTFHGRKIPLYRYDGAAPAQPTQDTGKIVGVMIKGEKKWVHPGIAAQGHQFKETSPTRYRDAFVARMESGHVGIFERTGGVAQDGSDEIQEVMGSSVPQMLGSPEVEERLAEEAMDKFRERLDQNAIAILNGLWKV